MTTKKSHPKRKQATALTAEERKLFEARLKNTKIELVGIQSITPNPLNAKKHPEHQIALLAENMRKYGITQPLLIDEHSKLWCGHARLEAAKRMEAKTVPVIRLNNLSDTEKGALAIADNQLPLLGEWDMENLVSNLKFLVETPDLNFDIGMTGFSTVETDNFLYGTKPKHKDDAADKIPSVSESHLVVTMHGDLWKCGPHYVLCGDARSASSFHRLLGDDRADMVFTDHPYNVPIRGHVSKRADAREFMMASGEMSSDEFIEFLRNTAALIVDNVREGAVMYLCIDWSHYYELLQATHRVLGKPRNLVVWGKTNAGMGSFYRSQHELIPVFVAPGASPTNNFGLGARGRYRSNLWAYPGVNTLGSERDATLAMHPTVKPVALVADAIRDCSHRGEIILDPFGGSGTTMIAAQKTGRMARLMEIDPLYCDVIIRRFEQFAGVEVVHVDTGKTFAELASARSVVEVV